MLRQDPCLWAKEYCLALSPRLNRSFAAPWNCFLGRSNHELLERMQQGWEWTAINLPLYAERARSMAIQIQAALHLTIRKEMSDVQIVHQLLSQFGLKL